MRTRTVFAGLPAAAILGAVLLSPPAAAEPIVPSVEVCVDARVELTSLLSTLDMVTRSVERNVPAMQSNLVALRAQLTALENSTTPVLLSALATLRTQIAAAEASILTEQGRLTTARANVAASVLAEREACAVPVTEEEPTPVTTTPATPTPEDDEDDEEVALLPASNDQFSRLPRNGVDTGSVPA